MESILSYSGQSFAPVNNVSFSSLNSISGMTLTTVGSAKTLYLPNTTSVADQICGEYIAAPGTPYCLIANLVANPGTYLSGNALIPCIGFYDGTKLITLNQRWSSGVTMGYEVYYWTNTTTFNSALYTGANTASGISTANSSWLQIRDDGTNIYFYVANDGLNGTQPKHWVKIYQEGRTSHLANVNNILWGADPDVSYGNFLTLNSWQTVAL